MSRRFLFFAILFLSFHAEKIFPQEPVFVNPDIVQVKYLTDSAFTRSMVETGQIYAAGLDTLPQMKFWRRIMNMSPDSGLVTMMYDRRVAGKISTAYWESLGKEGQDELRDSVRKANNFPDSAAVVFTKGKNDFYNPNAAIPQIDRAIPIFIQQDVDPFYAQAILLIESPGKNLQSNVGARGSFQLMKGVAQSMGLKVNKTVDERDDFDKSAWAAAKLLKTICIPYTNAMLDKRGISYNPNDLWYRLLVLHVYHAGAGNVDKALSVIDPCDGGMWLIEQLWQTKAGDFGRSSQSYSQVVIAAMLELDAVTGRNRGSESDCIDDAPTR